MATLRYPLTEQQKKAIAQLAQCSFQPGTFEKRFARDVNSQVEQGLTRKQYEFAKKMLYRYRRQLFGVTNDKNGQVQRSIDVWFPDLPVEASEETKPTFRHHPD